MEGGPRQFDLQSVSAKEKKRNRHKNGKMISVGEKVDGSNRMDNCHERIGKEDAGDHAREHAYEEDGGCVESRPSFWVFWVSLIYYPSFS